MFSSLRSFCRLPLRIFLILSTGLLLQTNSVGNPIIPPPIISEIYFGPDGFQLECYFWEEYGISNLDGVRITGLYDTANFNNGIEITSYVVYTFTQEDLQTEFYINPEGDQLYLEQFDGGEWQTIGSYGLYFGDNMVNAPEGEQSIAWVTFECIDGNSYWLVKELPNSIGDLPFVVLKRAQFCGYVRDKNNDPLPDVIIEYDSYTPYYCSYPDLPDVRTDSNGYFYTDEMYCRKYNDVKLRLASNYHLIGDTAINIEPDSANCFEFNLDTLLTGISEFNTIVPKYSIYNIPNPFSQQTTFVIEATDQKAFQKGVIKIYSNEGYIVDILPVELTGNKQQFTHQIAEGSLPAGVYYYNLEINHQKKASGKMVLGK